MRKAMVITGIAICIICTSLIFGVFFVQRDAALPRDLTLSNYPKVFAKEVVIVIGENASQQTFKKSLTKKAAQAAQIESADAIAANIEYRTGNKSEVINTKRGVKNIFQLLSQLQTQIKI